MTTTNSLRKLPLVRLLNEGLGRSLSLFLLILVAQAIPGCGGGVGGTGGGGGGDGGGGGGGVGGTGIVAMGAVKSAGPTAVTVNNTAYQVTAKTKVTFGAQPVPVTDLQPGMVVEVGAYKYTDTQITEAETITYNDALTGPITSIAANCSSMIVLGQTVEVDSYTLPTLTNGLCDFTAGQVVEISGYISDVAANIIRASFIRLKSTLAPINVSGTIASVSIPQKTFVIGGITIDYASAVVEPIGTVPEGGRFVRVTGISTTSDTITATKIEFETHVTGGEAGREAEVTGFVSALSGFNFNVNGRAIDASRAKISPTNTVLANGLKVEVHGKISAQSIIVATEIEVKPAEPIKIQSTLETTSAKGFTLLGVPILINDSTLFENDSATTSKTTLSDLNASDQVSVSCYRDDAGNLIASKVTLKNPNTKVSIEGEVVGSEPGNSSFVIIGELNFVVVIGERTQMKNKNGAISTAAEFLASLHPGTRVKVEGIKGVGKSIDAKNGNAEIKD